MDDTVIFRKGDGAENEMLMRRGDLPAGARFVESRVPNRVGSAHPGDAIAVPKSIDVYELPAE